MKQEISSKQAIVIGAGIGGLATAVRLRCKGYTVQVFEANDFPGGKLAEFELDGYRFDAGPSLFTMPNFVDELFELAGKNPREHFNYQRLERVCNYFWQDGTRLSSYSDASRFAAEIEQQLGVPRAAAENAFADAKLKYDLTATTFLYKNLRTWRTWWTRSVGKALLRLLKLHVFKTLDEVNSSFSTSPKFRQLLNRYATYVGSNPYTAPGILSSIHHLEQGFGAWLPIGGMYQITQSVYCLAQDLGVEFHFNSPVTAITTDKGRVTGVTTAKGSFGAGVVVSNMDVYYTYKRLMPNEMQPQKTLGQPRSSSAIVFYWGIARTFPELEVHNVLFSQDFRLEMDTIFQDNSISDDPTIYINITAKRVPTDAPVGCENWFVMINVPPNTGQDWDCLIAKARQEVIAKINRTLGVDIEQHLQTERVFDPRIIEQRASTYQGSIYGTSANNRMAAFMRHPNFSNRIKGLYFVGTSVHPGGGIPLALSSAKIAAGLIPAYEAET